MHKQHIFKENIPSPTKYRKKIAMKIYRYAEQIFGDRWKGMYIVGSAAVSMSHQFSDLDLIVVTDKPKTTAQRKLHTNQWSQLFWFGGEFERVHGVRVEFLTEGLLPSEAVPYGSEFEPNLLVAIDTAKDPEYYTAKDKGYLGLYGFQLRQYPQGIQHLRGETPEALEARLEFQRLFIEEIRRFCNSLRKILPKSALGEFHPLILALAIIDNFVPSQFYPFNYLEFLVSNEMKVRSLFGPVFPNLELSKLNELRRIVNSNEGKQLRIKLLEFSRQVEEQGFTGIDSIFD